ncbi:hypothetical protein EBB07_33830 [Paenibacillaceae bacterium]|nr:hypothetical protein EBB07_33830 [Paenibacillaceae bacterium]
MIGVGVGSQICVFNPSRVIAWDDFTRPNAAALGRAVTGQSWVVVDGSMAIKDNIAQNTANTASNIVYLDAGEKNVMIEAKIFGLANRSRVVFRHESGPKIFVISINNSNGQTQLRRNLDGVQTVLASGNIDNFTPNGIVRVRLLGDQISIWYNNVPMFLALTIIDDMAMNSTSFGVGSEWANAGVDWFRVMTI